MTFDASAHPRATDGKFSEKLGTAAEVTLDAESDDKLAAKLKRAGNRSGDKRYDITDGDLRLTDELVESLSEREPDDALIEAAETFAERLEDANAHTAARRVDAAVAEALYRADPDAPVKNPSAVMQVSTDMALVRHAAAQYGDRLRESYIAAGNAQTADLWAQERTDNNLVFNKNLDEALARELHARVSGWRRDELLENPSLPADLR